MGSCLVRTRRLAADRISSSHFGEGKTKTGGTGSVGQTRALTLVLGVLAAVVACVMRDVTLKCACMQTLFCRANPLLLSDRI
jgi:hypothetical protein